MLGSGEQVVRHVTGDVCAFGMQRLPIMMLHRRTKTWFGNVCNSGQSSHCIKSQPLDLLEAAAVAAAGKLKYVACIS
jgi:hypothetical protein